MFHTWKKNILTLVREEMLLRKEEHRKYEEAIAGYKYPSKKEIAREKFDKYFEDVVEAEADEEEEESDTEDVTIYCYVKRYLSDFIEPVVIENYGKRDYSEAAFKVKSD